MNNNIRNFVSTLFLSACLLFSSAAFSMLANNPSDPYYEPQLANPAHNTPIILMDETHDSFLTVGDLYKGFSDLLSVDGYQIRTLRTSWTSDCVFFRFKCEFGKALNAARIFVIVNPQAEFEAFENQMIVDWVRAGGRLLLITDHRGLNEKAAGLARYLGLEASTTTYPKDEFHRAAGEINGNHSIANGRDITEQVNLIRTYTGAGYSIRSTVPADAQHVFVLTPADNESLGIAVQIGSGRAYVSGEAKVFATQGNSLVPPIDYPSGLTVLNTCVDQKFKTERECRLELAKENVCEALNNPSPGYNATPPRDCPDVNTLVIDEAVRQYLVDNHNRVGLPAVDNQQYLLNIIHWLDEIVN